MSATERVVQERARRVRAARYDVFRRDDSGYWTQIGEDVGAPSRREAIKAVLADTPPATADGEFGTFPTVLVGEFKVTTRSRESRPVELWS